MESLGGLGWRVHPAAERRGATVALAAVIVVCLAAVWAAFHDPFLLALAVLIFAAALSAWFLPTTYRMGGDGITATRCGVRRTRRWPDVRRVVIDGRGATLSPFPRASWLDPYRSLRLLFGRHHEEVVRALRERLPDACALGARRPGGAAQAVAGRARDAGSPRAVPSPERVAAGEDAEIASAIDAAARAVVSRGMSAPAILLLESSKPVAFLGSQALHFLDPFVRSLFDAPRYEILARALEDRENVERLLVRIEQLEEDARLASERARAGDRPRGAS